MANNTKPNFIGHSCAYLTDDKTAVVMQPIATWTLDDMRKPEWPTTRAGILQNLVYIFNDGFDAAERYLKTADTDKGK